MGASYHEQAQNQILNVSNYGRLLGTSEGVGCPTNVATRSYWRLFLFFLLFSCLSLPRAANAQGAHSGFERSGFELALHGDTTVRPGHTARFRGIAYQVQGLAKLVAMPHARVRARHVTEFSRDAGWLPVAVDKRGFFQIDLPIDKRISTNARGYLEVRISEGDRERTFAFDLSYEEAWVLDLMTDRRLYQPGEKVHAWARIRDKQSRKPLAKVAVEFTVTGTSLQKKAIVVGESGVAFAEVVIPKEAKEGEYYFFVNVNGETSSRSFHVGTRSYERLFAKIETFPKAANPGQAVRLMVTVKSASGVLVRNAEVVVKLGETQARATTNEEGLAVLDMHAPSYLKHATGNVPILASIHHSAHGSANAHASLGLSVPRSVSVLAMPRNGALVPELPGEIFLRLSEGTGEHVPVGTSVEVLGPAILGGSKTAKTDVHGMIRVPAKLPQGASTNNGEKTLTTITVKVAGEAPYTVALTVPVARNAEVVPLVSKPVAGPGEALRIQVLRRKSAKNVPVVLEILSDYGLVESHILLPGRNTLKIKAPRNLVGVVTVRARPVHQSSSVEGIGASDAFLVRPAHPSFPTLKSDKKVYPTNATAHLTLKTTPGPEARWVSILVRDLAAHAGEFPFDLRFLRHAFDESILDPQTKASDTFLRIALADWIGQDAHPELAPPLLDDLGNENEPGYEIGYSGERETMRDPFPLSEELTRRGTAKVTTELESMLAEALENDLLDEVAMKVKGRYRFRNDLFESFDEIPVTLGDGKLTMAMLHAADRGFTYDNVGRRVARKQLLELLVALAYYLDPGDDATPQQRSAAREPSERWLSRMVERGLIRSEQLADPWGNRFALRRSRAPAVAIAIEAVNLELVSPGPDGKFGTRDDLSDPFARAVPQATPYALASGEDRLMEELSRLSPGAEVLRRLLRAYQRVTLEVTEEVIGDAVSASMSEGWGSMEAGSYGYGISGSGSGGGHGSLGRRSTRAPQVRIGNAQAGVQASGFAQVLRERFPPTLFFAPSMKVDPSGSTKFTLPLSEAITSYIVEAVVWSEEGWTWSTRTEVSVDKETVIDAPVPLFATVGDTLRLPVRVGNRSPQDRKVDISVFSPKGPELLRKGVLVPARDTTQEVVFLKLPEALSGKITLGVRSEQGVALDAVRRPITVQQSTRRVRLTEKLLMRSTATKPVRLHVHRRANSRDGSEVIVRVGRGIFELERENGGAQWAASWTGSASLQALILEELREGDLATLAQAIAIHWQLREVPTRFLELALKRLTQHLDTVGKLKATNDTVRQRANILLRLAPITTNIAARKAISGDVKALLRGLRKALQSSVAEVGDDAHLLALSAAALAMSAPANANKSRVRELVRRVRRHQLEIGTHTWVATKENVHQTSALLALAELSLGERDRAVALLGTLGQLSLDDRLVDPWTKALARVVLLTLSKGSKWPTEVVLRIDGKQVRVPLQSGIGRAPAPALSTPGSHVVLVESNTAAEILYHIEAVSEHGLPWDLVPKRAGSLRVKWDGKIGALDDRSNLHILIHNRSPRAIASPILDISVPAGAELDEKAKQQLAIHTNGFAEATRGTLRLHLHGLPPGAKRKIPLPFRWSVGGTLQGLGVASYPEDQPEDVSILAPRYLHIQEVSR